MTLDPKNYSASGKSNPAGRALAVTPADVDLAEYSQAIYVGGAGDLVVIMAGESVDGGTTTVTFVGVGAGSILPIRVAQIKAATSATDIVALY